METASRGMEEQRFETVDGSIGLCRWGGVYALFANEIHGD